MFFLKGEISYRPTFQRDIFTIETVLFVDEQHRGYVNKGVEDVVQLPNDSNLL